MGHHREISYTESEINELEIPIRTLSISQLLTVMAAALLRPLLDLTAVRCLLANVPYKGCTLQLQ